MACLFMPLDVAYYRPEEHFTDRNDLHCMKTELEIFLLDKILKNIMSILILIYLSTHTSMIFDSYDVTGIKNTSELCGWLFQ